MGVKIGIEGNIGIGKTTFGSAIRETCPWVNVIDEPWEDYKELLENYYHNPEYWAFPFQIAILSRRAHTHYQVQKDDGVFLIERTIHSDYHVFSKLTQAKGYLTDVMYDTYQKIYHDMFSFVKPPELFLYLRGDLDLLEERIRKRNRDGEEKITREYLKQIQDLYDNWLLNEPNCRVIDVDHDFSIKEMVSIFTDTALLIEGVSCNGNH